MKKFDFKKVLAGLAATLLLPGCGVHNAAVSSSSAPFFLAYDSEEVIRDQSQVATITSTIGLEIDGFRVSSKNFRSAHTGGLKGSVVVADVLPGVHSIKALNDPSGNPVRMSAITYDFEAGKIYTVGINLVHVFVEENTSPDVARKIAENRKNNEFENAKREKTAYSFSQPQSVSNSSASNSSTNSQTLALGEWTIANYQGALDFCEASRKDGYYDWRLPTLQEMDAIWTKVYLDAQSPIGWHWTSTVRGDDDLFVKNVKSGKRGTAPQRKKITVRCVRSE
ncbi:MAG: DUF1566 domain-containing protein [Dysgonamonadaceae bacterium]|jgi:hypothetical protein|nr:DUF1566 domain-containing protein [Dysgonamonadaceae bacterium]